MMLKKNLRALAKRNALLVSKLSDMFSGAGKRMNSEQVQWGQDLLQKEIPYVRAESGNYVSLCSEYSAENQLDKWFLQFGECLKEDSFVYLMGVGTGDILSKIANELNSDGTLVVYEPLPELFFQLIERFDFSDIFSKTNIFLFLENINDDEISTFLREYCMENWIRSEKMIVMHLPNYQSLYPQMTEKFNRFLVEWDFKVKLENATTRRFLQERMTAVFERIYYYKDALLVERLRGHWDTDIPIVMVAAGPSLKKNIKLLKQAKGHMLIVAVFHALPALYEEGIVPDIIASEDSRNTNIKVGEEFRNVALMCSTSAPRELFDWITGKKMLVIEYPEIQRLKPKDSHASYNALGSVAIIIVAVFAMLKAKHIILLGQDLAYSKEGYSHVGGVKEVSAEAEMLPGYYGGKVRSRPDWNLFWHWYVKEIPNMKDTQIINATEGGAHIPGTIQMPFREVLERFGDYTLDLSILEEKKYRMTEKEYADLKSGIDTYVDEVKQLYTWTEEDYKNNKEKFRHMGIYVLLKDMIYAMNEESEWKAFQKVLGVMKENGWT